MAWYPHAVRRPLPENATQPKIAPRVIILHRAVDGRVPNQSIYPLFNTPGNNLESHFFIFDNGTVEQYMDTNVQADANYKANGFAVSVETEDDGVEKPWTPAQLSAIIRLVAWLCDIHDIPRRLCDRWDGSGIGWHVQWGAPGAWTPVAKICPGPNRISQIRTVIIPSLTITADEEIDVTPTEHAWLEDILRRIQSMHVYGFRAFDPDKTPPPGWRAGGDLSFLDERDRDALADLNARVAALQEAVEHLGALWPPPKTGPGPTAAEVVDELLARLKAA